MLSAATCCNWWVEKILSDDYSSVESQNEKLGENKVFFLPYLMGERSPLNDSEIRGMFYGLSLATEKDEMSLAVLEGVAFALRQNIEIIRKMGIDITSSSICGGGTKNKLRLKIIANVLCKELNIPQSGEGASLGAAMLAAKGEMTSEAYTELEKNIYRIKEKIAPENELVEKYDIKYNTWKKLYPALKNIQS